MGGLRRAKKAQGRLRTGRDRPASYNHCMGEAAGSTTSSGGAASNGAAAIVGLGVAQPPFLLTHDQALAFARERVGLTAVTRAV